MIDVTRLNGHRLLLNSDLIRYAEAAPDTTISLVTGEKLIVLESCDELLKLTAAYRASLLRAAWPQADAALHAQAGMHAHTTHLQHERE